MSKKLLTASAAAAAAAPRDKRTKGELAAALDEASKYLETAIAEAQRERVGRIAAEKSRDETHRQFAELKERLHAGEVENATMRGYIDRCQEDDHAREELVTTGDSAGDQQLVPKRKHRMFPVHRVEYGGAADGKMSAFNFRDGEAKPRPKHWVNY